jgi:hypothetical protein
MAGFVVMIVVFVIWVLAKAISGNTSALLSSGAPARGILLSVSNQALGSVGTGLRKLQQRQVRIDIEIPGQPPYELNTIVLVPLNLVADVLPGATVEIRVSKSNRRIVIVGPGVGFGAATLATQGRVDQGAA